MALFTPGKATLALDRSGPRVENASNQLVTGRQAWTGPKGSHRPSAARSSSLVGTAMVGAATASRCWQGHWPMAASARPGCSSYGGRDRTTVNLGLGAFEAVTLQQARERAAANAVRLRAGEDVREPRGLPPAKLAPTLRKATEGWFDLRRESWRAGGRHETLVRQRLTKHAPGLLDKRVDAIARRDVLDGLLKVEKAGVRDRCATYLRDIFTFAILSEWRTDNPVDDALMAALSSTKKQPTKHYAALRHSGLAAALAKVDAHANWPPVALATRFIALTCAAAPARSGARAGTRSTWRRLSGRYQPLARRARETSSYRCPPPPSTSCAGLPSTRTAATWSSRRRRARS